LDALFCDTSAIIKRYVSEIGSPWLREKVDPGAGVAVYLATISAVEVASAITRRQRGGSLPQHEAARFLAQFRSDLDDEYRTIHLGDSIIAKAMDFAEARALRAYDAVQLAAAVELNRWRIAMGKTPIIFLSSDGELNAAALAVGLNVDDPNTHP